MSRVVTLIQLMTKSIDAGHSGIFSVPDLALMLQLPLGPKVNKALHQAQKTGVLKRVCKGFYISPLNPPAPDIALANLVQLLRPDRFNYISLESELSHVGVISQVMFDYLTVMTTGRKGVFKTVFGTIEFTHTKRTIEELSEQVYFDDRLGMYRATVERAISDLKRVGRNIDMLERDHA